MFLDYAADKGVIKHSDVEQEDYEKVQWRMEHGTAVQDRDNSIVFMEKWKATVKRTRSGRSVFLTILYRIGDSYEKSVRERGDQLEGRPLSSV